MITFVATAYKETIDAYMFLSSLLLQTNKNWKCIIACDGRNDYIIKAVNFFNDERINIIEFNPPNGYWGHPNRKYILDNHVTTPFILQTSIQDYFTPNAIEDLNPFTHDFDFIYYNSLHNHFNHNIFTPELRPGGIDWGNFILRTDLAKAIGINSLESGICDGFFVEKCIKYPNLRIHKLDKILTIHN
jgi:hypothetical protein